MIAKDFERKVDAGDDIREDPDLTRAKRPGLEQNRVNFDFPARRMQSLDKVARRLGAQPVQARLPWPLRYLTQSCFT